jgi:acetoacetate decarboxylase
MMTLDEARVQVGARVTHHATGVIQDVTDHYIWIRYDSDPTALKSARPEDLTVAEPAAEPADGVS